MANVERLEQKFLDLITNESNFAVALTGDWGIGKTEFWKAFRDKNENILKGNKYAYVSLFGIDSLESLKLAIATEVHKTAESDSVLDTDITKTLKEVFSFVGGGSSSATTGDFRFGINIGNKLVTNLMMAHLKNTLVCLDDIERKSANLPISEVIGLINYLKNERNCQVVMLLNNEESEDREYFDKHKEKVFDEILVLDDNLDLLQTFIKDELALNIMQNFYKTLRVKNLRFYNKVFKNYQQITDSIILLSNTSKEHILKNLLVIRWIDEFQPVIPLKNDESFKANLDLFYDENNEFIPMSDDNFLKQDENFKAFRRYLEPFYPLFLFDNWAKHIINMLKNHDISEDAIQDLLEKDILSEGKFQDELILEQVMNEFFSLKLQPHFCERLYYSACTKIQKSELSKISFYCDILEHCDRGDLAQQLENHVKKFITRELNSSHNKPYINTWYPFDKQPNDRFYHYIEACVESYQPRNIDHNIISLIFLAFHKNSRNAYNSDDKIFLSVIDKDILKTVIWLEIGDERRRKYFIHSILLHPLLNDIEGKREEVRKWIIELLHEKIAEDSNTRVPIEMWLDSTNNLTKDLF